MSDNGRESGQHSQVLAWPHRVLSFDALRRNLNGHRELLLGEDTIITPLAADELRTVGVRIVRQSPVVADSASVWGHGQDRPYPIVESALRSLAREGIGLRQWPECNDLPCRWARLVAECVARGECTGGVLFASDPGLICCVANKMSGLRAVAVTTVQQAARATLTLAANLLVVEMPGRTFYEVRQILRSLTHPTRICPDGVACTLKELDGHAHR